jgi:hypothetical protein
MSSVYLSAFAGAGWQFFSNTGQPLAGGMIYTYAAGTSAPAATYNSNLGNVANTNPIILDAYGRVPNEIWLTVGSAYKFVLQDSSAVQIGTWDNISGAVGSQNIVTSFSGGSTGLTPATATIGAVTLSGTLNVANGGTGLSTVGTAGQFLTSNGISVEYTSAPAYNAVGSYAFAYSATSYAANTSVAGSGFTPVLSGTWQTMGGSLLSGGNYYYLLQRTA